MRNFFLILMDEMKIQSNLIWDKHTRELIRYVDLGDTELNHATPEKTDNIATHLLAFLIFGIVNHFKFSLANFSASGASASQMFPLLWKAISICELNFLKLLLTLQLSISKMLKNPILTYLAKTTDFSIFLACKSIIESLII